MNKIVFALLLSLSFMGCDKDDDSGLGEMETEATLLGRWVLEGFNDNIRYDFTADKQHTIYADSTGVFPDLEDFLEQNPGLTGNDWSYSGDTVIIDLNFGNFSKMIPTFKCDNDVIAWTDENGDAGSTYYREEHDITECN